MSKRANSPRQASDMPTRANLLAEYSGQAGIPLRPHMEVTFTTTGRLPIVRYGIAKRVVRPAEEVDLHHLPQDFGRRRGEVAPAPDSGVIDEQVESAERVDRPINESLAIGRSRDVGGDGDDFRVEFPQGIGQVVEGGAFRDATTSARRPARAIGRRLCRCRRSRRSGSLVCR